MSSDAERFQLIRPLGSGSAPFWAAIDSRATARARLVVVERISPADAQDEKEVEDWLRNARMLATLEHMNVARVREVVARKGDSLVVSDYVDGVRWSEIVGSPEQPPLELMLRVLIDALAGLSAIHNLRDASKQPLNLVFGGLTPSAIVVGLEGVSKLVGAHRFRQHDPSPDEATSGYLAPEVLLADDSADARADVYSAGVLLWEALSGRPLFPNMQASAIVTQALSGPAPRATVPDKLPWAAPLVDAAARALSAEPAKRHPSAAAFAADLRRIAGPKLAQPPRVAALIRGSYGEVIRMRREAIEQAESGGHAVPSPAAEPTREPVDTPVRGAPVVAAQAAPGATPAQPPVAVQKPAPAQPPVAAQVPAPVRPVVAVAAPLPKAPAAAPQAQPARVQPTTPRATVAAAPAPVPVATPVQKAPAVAAVPPAPAPAATPVQKAPVVAVAPRAPAPAEIPAQKAPGAAAQPARMPSEVPVDVDFGDETAAVPTPPPPADPDTRRPPPARVARRPISEDPSETRIFAAKPVVFAAKQVAPSPPRLPPTALRVPPAPKLPQDLRPPEDDGIHQADAIGLESVRPSLPPTASTSPDSLPVSRRPQKRRAFVAISAVLLLVPAVLWWVAPRPGGSTSPVDSASASSSAPAASAVASAPRTPMAQPTATAQPSATATASAATAPSASIEAPAPSATASAAPEPAAPATASTGTAAATAPTAEPPPAIPSWPPGTSLRPPTKKKYEPEGI